MSNITQIVKNILVYTNKGDRLNNVLNKSLNILEIEDKLKNFKWKIPQELKELYQWHNGTSINNDVELFYYHYFLSLDESLKVYHQWNEYNKTSNFNVYPDNLFPIFGFEGEYYAIECFLNEEKTGKIWHIYHDNICVYDSLLLMLQSFFECYEKEAYKITFVNGYWETEVDEKKVAEIKLKYNSVRENLVKKLAKTDQYFEYP